MGIGDELGQGGFRGRVKLHYDAYTHWAFHQRPRPECPWVFIHGDGVYDRHVGHIALTLGAELDLVDRKGLPPFGSRLVAVLLMGASLGDYLHKYDGTEYLAMHDYQAAMDVVRNACEMRGVSTIGVSMPLPNENFRLATGRKPSRRLREETIGFSRDHLSSWGVPHTHFLSLEEIITDPATQRAPDGAHLSAAGYDIVAKALIRLIDPILGVDTSPAT